MTGQFSPLFSYSLKSVLLDEFKMSVKDLEHCFSIFRSNNPAQIKDWSNLREWLINSEARNHWNKTFINNRAKFLADWVSNYIKGETVLDMLCGNGEIGKLLNERYPVNFTERDEHYDEIRADYSSHFFSMHEIRSQQKKWDTTLLITVLHHELDPVQTAKIACEYTKKRIIVVENCINDLFDKEFQVTIDLFFNDCLNQTKIPSPASHKTINDWVDLFTSFGLKFVAHDMRTRIPGIPMPHDLMVFDFENT